MKSKTFAVIAVKKQPKKSKTYVERMVNDDEQLPGNSQNAIEWEGRISFESLFSSPWI